MDKETVDRMILLGMDVDRYQTEMIPDLQETVGRLTRALSDLVQAVRAASRNQALAVDVETAAARAEQILEARILPAKGGQL